MLVRAKTLKVWDVQPVDCSQSPIFSWDRLDIPRLTVTGILIFKCTEGAGVGDYSSGGWGWRGEKNNNNNNNNKFIQYYHFVQVLPIKTTIINS